MKSRPSPDHDPVIINLDAVKERLGRFGMSEEELCHLLSQKLIIHRWIFDGERDGAVIPIGRLLFGVFSWTDARDVIYCRKLMRLRADHPTLAWQTWSRLLSSYNDLAALEYRRVQRPADPAVREALEEATTLFAHHLEKYLVPAREAIRSLEMTALMPHLEMAIAEVDRAKDELQLARYRQVVVCLELALTNYHTVVNGVQPPEDDGP